MNLGLVNLDTSHVIAFTEAITSDPAYADLRVTHAWRGESHVRGAADIEAYALKLRDAFGVTLVDDLAELVDAVDAALIEANEGARHLAQAAPFLRAGKRCWVDKPLAATADDARRILALAAEHGTSVFSASALRYAPEVAAVAALDQPVLGADVITPAPQHWANPGLLHYGIHGVEILLALLGPDCVQVSCVRGADGEVCTGLWADGRLGTLRAAHGGPHLYALRVVLGGERTGLHEVRLGLQDIYRPLLAQVALFLRGGVSPLTPDAMVATIAFCEAARESARLGGAPVRLGP